MAYYIKKIIVEAEKHPRVTYEMRAEEAERGKTSGDDSQIVHEAIDLIQYMDSPEHTIDALKALFYETELTAEQKQAVCTVIDLLRGKETSK